MKKLEGEVLETLAQLGEPESMGLDRETVDPHQFLGLELNPRAAAIAELVVWIGYLQQHYRTRTGHPSEPILRAFENINFGRRQGYDAVLTWDGYPVPKVAERDGRRVETYPNPRRPEWPEAEFIVGNPPFVGKGKDMRDALGGARLRALWDAHPQINESADFVMFWWDMAAEKLTAKESQLRRFGLVTTSSVTQEFSRRVIRKRLESESSLSIVYAVPNHPWYKASSDTAAVRIAMTVAAKGEHQGILQTVVQESNLDTDEPKVECFTRFGFINADLTVGVDATASKPLLSNEGVSCNGYMLAGRGFILEENQYRHFKALEKNNTDEIVFPLIGGRDLVQEARGRYVIDLFGLNEEQVRTRYPHLYQHLLLNVKPERSTNNRKRFRDEWWLFGEPRKTHREAMRNLARCIGTTETSRHRIFQLLPSKLALEHKVVAFSLEDAFFLGVLSSKVHRTWAVRAGGWLGVGNDSVYVKSKVFDPFPFPDPPESLKAQIRTVAEELDAFRKSRQAEHPKLTLTQMYNVLEKLKAMAATPSPSSPGLSRGSTSPTPARSKGGDGRDEPGHDGGRVTLTPDEERIKDEGLILILKELHERLDRLVFQAYGWPADLSDEEILERLLALNAERAREEAAGHVRWLRPDYQIPRFAKGAAAAKTGELDLGENVVAIDRSLPDFPKDRHEDSLAVEHALLLAGRPMDASQLARSFKRGGKRIEPRVAQALTTLVRYGRITMTGDGRYLARRAA
jgi:hypothetical protein